MYLGILLNFLLLIEANFCVNCWVDNIPLLKKLMVLSLRPGGILNTEEKKTMDLVGVFKFIVHTTWTA